jgi:hypothetical protein
MFSVLSEASQRGLPLRTGFKASSVPRIDAEHDHMPWQNPFLWSGEYRFRMTMSFLQTFGVTNATPEPKFVISRK